MNRDSRLSVALHVLLHISEMDGAVTSEAIGSMMDTNPVVIRRTLGGLRDAGIVVAEKGHGGGWSLARDLRSISLNDVYEAIGISTAFGIGVRDSNTRCVVERAVNQAVGEVLEEAEALLMKRLRAVTVADIVKRAARGRTEIGKSKRAKENE